MTFNINRCFQYIIEHHYSMDVQYEQHIYHIITLIQRRKYHRAINIAEFLIQQGIKNNQVLLLLSYCYRMSQGPQKAIQVIQQKQSNSTHQNVLESGNSLGLAIAKGQYYAQLGKKNDAAKMYSKIVKQQKSHQSLITNRNQKFCTIMQNNTIISLSQEKPSCYPLKQWQVQEQKEKFRQRQNIQPTNLINVAKHDCQFINSINDITQNYKNGKLKPLETYMLYKKILGEMQYQPKKSLLKYRPIQTTTKQNDTNQLRLDDILKQFMQFLIFQMKTFNHS